jgi:general secretion pathway protein C
MNRAPVYIASGALLAVCCWLTAGVLISIWSSLGETTSSVQPPAPSPPQRARTWEDRQQILTRNLFEASTLAPAVTAVAEEERYQKTKLSLRLLGTAASSIAAESTAAVEDLKKRRHDVVRVGSEIQGAKVIAIDPRRIVFENRGRREELALEEDAQPSPRTAGRRTPTRPPRASGVRNVGRNRFEVDRSQVEELASNPAALFSQARIIPKYDNGEMTGVQLNAIKPGSLFEQAGLQDGDTVTVLNGIAATSQQGSQQLLQELRTADEWSLTVRDRNGAERTVDFVKN